MINKENATIDLYYKDDNEWKKGIGSLYVQKEIYSGDWDRYGDSKKLTNVLKESGDFLERPMETLYIPEIDDAVEFFMSNPIYTMFKNIIVRFEQVSEFCISDGDYPSDMYITEGLWFYGSVGTVMVHDTPFKYLRVPPHNIRTIWCHEQTKLIGLGDILDKDNKFSEDIEIEVGS